MSDAIGISSQLIQFFALRSYHHTVVHQRLHWLAMDNSDHGITGPYGSDLRTRRPDTSDSRSPPSATYAYRVRGLLADFSADHAGNRLNLGRTRAPLMLIGPHQAHT